MGATNFSKIIKASSEKSFLRKWKQYVSDCIDWHGSDPYNGTASTVGGIPRICPMKDKPKRLTQNQCERVARHLWNNTQKREAKYVRIGNTFIVAGWAAT